MQSIYIRDIYAELNRLLIVVKFTEMNDNCKSISLRVFGTWLGWRYLNTSYLNTRQIKRNMIVFEIHFILFWNQSEFRLVPVERKICRPI